MTSGSREKESCLLCLQRESLACAPGRRRSDGTEITDAMNRNRDLEASQGLLGDWTDGSRDGKVGTIRRKSVGRMTSGPREKESCLLVCGGVDKGSLDREGVARMCTRSCSILFMTR
jgi:hypothetical protein